MVKNFFSGLITPQFKKLHADAITELVTGCAIPCTLIYGQTLFVDCPNCIYDPVRRKSSGVYDSINGTQSFFGICPVCMGDGRFPDETSEQINLSVIYDYKSWIPMAIDIRSPYGFVQTLSLLDTIDKIKQAKEIIVDNSLQETVRQRFERHDEPQPCGFGQATIIVTMWKRIEN